MKIGNDIKTIMAWLGMVLVVSNVYGVVETRGPWRVGLAAAAIVLAVALWRWRHLLNWIRNTETTYSVFVFNKDGDALYEKGTTMLPLLWPVRESEIFVSTSGGRIEEVTANCDVTWNSRSDAKWHGTAHPRQHYALITAWRQPRGARVEIRSVWRQAFRNPPFDFVVASGERHSSRISIKVRWCAELRPDEVKFQMTPLPTETVREKGMLKTDELPWLVASESNLKKEEDGSYSATLGLDPPKKCVLYRVLWRPPPVIGAKSPTPA